MISAIVLAAGKSTRMGQNKMQMKWGDSTVLEKVIQTLRDSGIHDITVVTNSELRFPNYNLRIIENSTNGEMLSSIQLGLGSQNAEAKATLICLGDQPQIEERSVRSVYEAFRKSKSNLVVPSYQQRRGHPWLVARPLWNELLTMKKNQSPRDFLNAHANEIEYVVLDSASILEDLDTPEDYLKYKPNV